MTKPFRHSKIKKSYDPKELFHSLRYWLSRQQILFYSGIWYLSQTVAPVFIPDSFENTSFTSEVATESLFRLFKKVFSCGICGIFKNTILKNV